MSGADSGPLRVLRKKAVEADVGVLITTVRDMRSPGPDAAPARAAVNTNALVEFAAELRPPTDVAILAQELGGNDETADLARLALDAAAARRSVGDLAELVSRVTAADPGQVGRLLEAVVTRRMPQDIAALLVRLGNHRPELARCQDALVSQLSDERTQGDCRVAVVLWLRAHDEDDLAERVSRRMAEEEHLGPVELAGLVRGLLAQRDTASADVVISSALGRQVDEIAGLIDNLREGDGGQADRVADAALRQLARDDLLVLASLLDGAIWTAAAQRIWDEIIPGMPDRELADVLAMIASESGDHTTAARPLWRAALTYTTGQVAKLAIAVDHRITGGVNAILDSVVTERSVDEIFAVAGALSGDGWEPISRRLLSHAAQRIHERADGGEPAEFLHRWLAQAGANGQSWNTRWQRRNMAGPVLDRVAQQRNPEQLMGLIAGLTRYAKTGGGNEYEDHKQHMETMVGKHYQAAELIRLPQIRRLDYLPAVLDIERTALKHPRAMPAEQVPDLVKALRDSGANDAQLERLLSDIGAKNPESKNIGQALFDSGMRTEAKWVWGGGSGFLPFF